MTKRKRKANRKINKKAIWTIVVILILTIGLIGSTVGLVVLNKMLKTKPSLEMSNLVSKESSKIYDKDNNLIADVGVQIRTNIKYNQLPESLVDAFVSIEDSRFFEHPGFDVARFAKAMIENIKAMRFAQGGSTMTMQLIKLSFFTDDEAGIGAAKSIERKVQEIALSLELDKSLNKKEILELYLNKMNFGGSGNIRGIEKASYYYFGKSANELNVAESAILSGIINRPTAYNPFKYLDYATKRRNTVINMMVRHGYLSKTEGDLIKSIKVEDILVNPDKAKGTGSQEYEYQSYIDTVVNEAKELTGLDPTLVAMNIYTSMNPAVQKMMDSIQADGQEKVVFPDELMEIAMISVNNKTGEIVAVGGGRNYGRGGSLLLNHATEQFKQPGSSVKPFLSYALAFENLGWATSHVVTDKPIVYKGTTKVIKNANNKYAGQVYLEYALGQSLNTPAIQTLQDVVDKIGRAKVVEYLQNLGFSKVTNENFDIGFAIGGSNYTASALELAGAHATLANAGNYIKPHTIKKIEFTNGDDPIEPKYEPKQVISPQAAYLTTSLMYAAVNGPYTNYMQILKRDYPVYGKTGTTDWGSDGLQYNIPQGAAKDKWMVFETNDYTTSVWVGYEKGVKDKNTYFNSEKSKLNIPGNISSLILDSLSSENKPTEIARPDGISNISHIVATFPYAATIEGMDGSFVATGLIKDEFNKLENPETANVENLSSFSANLENGTINMSWAAYPDSSKLQVAPDTMDLGIDVGGTWLEAYGKRMFDYTWLFGPIRYKAKVINNGNVIAEVTSEGEHFSQGVDAPPGSTLSVCGYYAYENLGTASNEICQNVTVADSSITINVPSNQANQQDIENWLKTNGLKANVSTYVDPSKANTNEIKVNGVVANNQSIPTTQSQISNISIEITIYTAN
ncbi:MAG: transglycosylase domain-containing protein [Erysipelotrichaceae bacterium]|nr:transglycosylase domain-containing protein [Erysipelotrichaceae bacterium]